MSLHDALVAGFICRSSRGRIRAVGHLQASFLADVDTVLSVGVAGDVIVGSIRLRDFRDRLASVTGENYYRTQVIHEFDITARVIRLCECR